MTRPASNRRFARFVGLTTLRRWSATLLVAASLFFAGPAPALDADAHRAITLRALKGVADIDFVLTPTQKELVDFFSWFAFALAKGGDKQRQAQFQARYPEPTDFHAVAIRQFLGLSMIAKADVWGITRMSPNNAEQRENLLAVASAYPIADRRAADHVAINDDGEPKLDKLGQPTPLDPGTLAHGPMLGPGSDAWAQDALALGAAEAVTNLDDPDPSWREPGIAGAKPTNYAAQLCQTHLDIAVLARVWGDITDKVPAEQIATVWLGGAIHYAQNAALPTATAERGGSKMKAAVSAAYRRDALASFGGYIERLDGQIIRTQRARRNLHLLAERWLHDEIERFELRGEAHPAIKAALEAIRKDDEATRTKLAPLVRPWLNGARFTEPYVQGKGGGSKLVEAIAALSARDAPAMFDVLTELAAPGVANGDLELLDFGAVKSEHWAEAGANNTPEANDKLAMLMARTIARAATSSRLIHAFWINGSPDSAARRIQDGRLQHLRLAEMRLKAWQTNSLDPNQPVRDIFWALGPLFAGIVGLFAIIAGVVWVVRRSRETKQ